MGCCAKDAVAPGEEGRAQKLEEEKQKYEPTATARLPGSKCPLSEIQIEKCTNKEALVDLMKTAKKERDLRSGGCCSCCCSADKTFLSDWKYLEGEVLKEKIEEKVKEIKEEARKEEARKKGASGSNCCSSSPMDDEKESLVDTLGQIDVDGDGELDEETALPPEEREKWIFLGEKPNTYPVNDPPKFDPPNRLFYIRKETEGLDEDARKTENELRVNKKIILELMAEEEEKSLPFASGADGAQKEEIIANPSDKDVDDMDLNQLKKELAKRGHVKPPYKLMYTPEGGSGKKELFIFANDLRNQLGKDTDVEKNGLTEGSLANKCCNDAAGDCELKANAVLQACAFFGKKPPTDDTGFDERFGGLKIDPDARKRVYELVKLNPFPDEVPRGVKKIKRVGSGLFRDKGFDMVDKLKLRAFLKLCAEDPRFKAGQPVVSPSFYTRTCQNFYCTVLFWVYWVGMMVLLWVAIWTGDPYRMVRPIDYEGHSCFDESYESTHNKANLYYPQLAQDAFDLYQDGADQTCLETKEGCFYGVCVESCPVKGDVICNYAAEAELESICPSAGCPKIGTRNDCCTEREEAQDTLLQDNNGCWFVGMSQIEVLRRCFPWELPLEETDYACVKIDPREEGEPMPDGCSAGPTVEGEETLSCPIDTTIDKHGDTCSDGVCNTGQISARVAQECKDGIVDRTVTTETTYTAGTDDLSGMMTSAFSYVQQIFADVKNATVVIIAMGPIGAGTLGFGFIYIMSWIPGLIVWTTIVGVQMCLIVLTLFCFWMGGFFDQALENLTTSLASAANGTAITNATVITTQLTDVAANAQSFLENYDFYGDNAGESEYTNQTLWTVASWVMLALTVLYLVVICCVCKHIKLAIALVRETGLTLRKMKSLLLYPFFTYFWISIVFSYCIVIATFILSSTASLDDLHSVTDAVSSSLNASEGVFPNFGAVYSDAADALEVAYNATEARDDGERFSITATEENEAVKYMFLYHFFGFLWTSEFVSSIGMIVIAGAVASDYWVDTSPAPDGPGDMFKPDFPVIGSFGRTMKYHTGSAAYGSLIIALIRLARYIMMYIDAKTQELQKNNRAVLILMKVVHCCLYLLEKCVRYITMNAYIIIAIEGKGFCLSAWRSFKLLFSNALRIATTQVLATIITLLAQVFIILGCTCGTVLILSELEYFTEGEGYVENPLFPALLVLISSAFVANCFMQVYTIAINTLLLSFCLDEDKYKKGLYKKKKNWQGVTEGRMFCVLNKKVGLIQLVSKREQQEQDAQDQEKEEDMAREQAASK
eukprot:SAG11_NODE_997_length_6241_cov_7.990557_2_plen_1284_part_00